MANLDLEFPSGDPDCAEAAASAHGGAALGAGHAVGLTLGERPLEVNGTVENHIAVVPEYRSDEPGRPLEVHLVDEVLLPEQVYEQILSFAEEEDKALLGLVGLTDELF